MSDTPVREKTHLAMTVNGRREEVIFEPYKTLLEVLREDLQLTGTKHGCELGECGACAVLLDGKPTLSCLVLGIECEGRSVETVEGLAERDRLHPLQEAFADLGGAQCGYCTPGILVTAQELLELYDPSNTTRVTAGGIGRELQRSGFRQVGPVRTNRGVKRLYIARNVEKWARASNKTLIEHYNQPRRKV